MTCRRHRGRIVWTTGGSRERRADSQGGNRPVCGGRGHRCTGGAAEAVEAPVHDIPRGPGVAGDHARQGGGRLVRPAATDDAAEWVDEWLPVLRTQVRRQTYESYERNLRLHVLPTLGARAMQSIKAAELTTLYARLLVSGRVDHRAGEGLSARSVAYLATILGKCLEAAVRGELIASNPARRAEVPKASASATRHEQMRTWTQQQRGQFLDVSRGHPHWSAWLLLATTGLRRGEALGLAWSSVDLEAGRLSVSRTLVNLDGDEPVWSDPKTARGRRSIALDPGPSQPCGR